MAHHKINELNLLADEYFGSQAKDLITVTDDTLSVELMPATEYVEVEWYDADKRFKALPAAYVVYVRKYSRDHGLDEELEIGTVYEANAAMALAKFAFFATLGIETEIPPN